MPGEPSLGGFEIETELEIARDTVDVFDFLADTASFKVVDPALVEVGPAGRLTQGMTGRFLHRRAGLPARSTWRVTQADTPLRLVVEIQGSGYGMTETAELDPITTGTRARFTERVWPTSLAGRLMVALSGSIMRRDLAKRATLLKTALESPTGSDQVV